MFRRSWQTRFTNYPRQFDSLADNGFTLSHPLKNTYKMVSVFDMENSSW